MLFIRYDKMYILITIEIKELNIHAQDYELMILTR